MSLTRRSFLAATAVTAACHGMRWSVADEFSGSNLHLARFQFDVTPPLGHALCGGWIKPAVDVDDPLRGLGVVILGAGAPIVICTVDWTGVLNSAHVKWLAALAEAAGTTPDRVALQCVHQHNAPFACLETHEIVAEHADLPAVVDPSFFQQCLDRSRDAIREALSQARPLTHIAVGQAQVNQVASNRRFVGPDGKIQHWRGSSCRDPVLQQLPEGLVDPWLKTVAFYDGDAKIAACHYYATHPMSYYGDGRISSDFVGLARQARQDAEPDCLHLYFTGCAGNIAAGKYNEGTPQSRERLTQRIVEAITASEQQLRPQRVERIGWHVASILPAPREDFVAEELEQYVANKGRAAVDRSRAAFMLAWLRRTQQQVPILLSALHVNQVSLLHLPSEAFVEYQIFAQQEAAERFVATAAYGDGGPWYLPTAEAYPQGGYEVNVAFCAPTVDDVLRGGVKTLLQHAPA